MTITKSKPKSGRKCVLCTHPRRESMNAAVAMGQLSMTQVASQIGVNKSSVSRHFRRHLQPAMVAAGGGATLAWDVRKKSRDLTERMETLLNVITRDAESGENITKSELLESWQAIRAMGTEMREWMRLHGQATGELTRDAQNQQPMGIQIICPWTTADALPRVTFASDESIDDGCQDIGLLQRP